MTSLKTVAKQVYLNVISYRTTCYVTHFPRFIRRITFIRAIDDYIYSCQDIFFHTSYGLESFYFLKPLSYNPTWTASVNLFLSESPGIFEAVRRQVKYSFKKLFT